MGEDDATWVPYRNRPEWADVTPIPQVALDLWVCMTYGRTNYISLLTHFCRCDVQEESPNPVVKIDYADDFVDVMDYFRGIVAVGERSERALGITQEVIARNGASCTGWHWRWSCIQGLAGNLLEELVSMGCICTNTNPSTIMPKCLNNPNDRPYAMYIAECGHSAKPAIAEVGQSVTRHVRVPSVIYLILCVRVTAGLLRPACNPIC
eukprot:221327-Prorocentrum_minimum.AAC.2